MNDLSVEVAWSETSMDFLSALSKRILARTEARLFPDLITVAFFCRAASLRRAMKATSALDSRVGWGSAIHIAPSNIAANSVFTFIFGLVAGNRNVVRLPSKSYPQIDLFLEIYNELISEEQFRGVGERNSFITTERDSDELVALVSNADALVVWGGDATVRHFRRLDKKPRCTELYFPSRRSSLIIDSATLRGYDQSQMLQAANQFYNDTYLVDHNACSSPMTLGWVGKAEDSQTARRRFFESVEKVLLVKKHKLSAIAQIDRYLDVMRDGEVDEGKIGIDQIAPNIWLQDQRLLTDGRYGRFHSHDCENIEEFLPIISGDQTLTYIGFDPGELKAAVIQRGGGVDRIVPCGSALDMGFTWDGVDVISRLSKVVSER